MQVMTHIHCTANIPKHTIATKAVLAVEVTASALLIIAPAIQGIKTKVTKIVTTMIYQHRRHRAKVDRAIQIMFRPSKVTHEII
jgi:hypothetical protein